MNNLPMKVVVLGLMVLTCAASAQDQDIKRNMERSLQGVVKQRAFAYGLTLREGYDSNIYSRSDNVKGSFSTTASPDFQFGWSGPLTDVTAHYSYSAVYYESRPEKSLDQSHNLNVSVGHEFSPRLHVVFSDDFAPGFEPDIEEGTNQRSADYIQNTARLTATYKLDSRWDMTSSVRHYFINYSDDTVLPVIPGTPTSQTMNRQAVDTSVGVNYQPQSTTTLGAALSYNAVSYTGNNRDNSGGTAVFNVRHIFNPRLSADAAAGMSLRTYDVIGGESVNPDVNMGLSYLLTPRTSLFGRFSTRMQPTELGGYLESQTFMLSGGAVHQFTSRLMGSASVMYVPTEYQGSLVVPGIGGPGTAFNGNQSETSIASSLTLGYQFNVHLRGEIGYSFTHFTSDLFARDYDRHMTYLQARVGF
ncbi:MAG: outer membrane beta-barrel protein [Verrucomicrobia bacterium]|nr:outer membrane beta-barrel protein [Verrucomicrobiota bacterium]